MSIVFLFDENSDVASAGSGGAAVGGARSVPDHAARSNSERAAPSARVGNRFSAPQIVWNKSNRCAGERGGARVGRPRWARILTITCILGRGMYPGYEQYWRAILANPEGILPFTGKVASKGEIDYAHFADKTPHIVLSKTLDQVGWKNTGIVRDVEEIRKMKQQPGTDMYVVGGATLVSRLMNLGLIDELRLVIVPIVLGAGKALFKDVKERHALKFLGAKPLKSSMVRLTYST